MNSLSLLGFTLDFIGKILVSITVIKVHSRLQREHRVDKKVLREIKREQSYGYLGILLMVLGYTFHMLEYL